MRPVLLHAGMLLNRVRHWLPLSQAVDDPRTTQMGVLRNILTTNQHTRFGVDHGFDAIHSHGAFVGRVPLQTYDTLRPYVDEQRRTGSPALTSDAPLFYAQTSGTTGAPKYVPLTASMLALYKAEQALFSYLQYRASPDAFAGKAFGIMGAAVEGTLDTGQAVGSVSGYLYRSLPRMVQSRFVVPPEISSISDYALKYLVILRLALEQEEVTYLGTPNPSTFLRLLDLLNSQRDMLLQSLESGRFAAIDQLDAPMRQVVADRISAKPRRALELGRLASMTYANVWPSIRLLTTWTGGSCGIALGSLRGKLPNGTKVMELGYQSTEFRGTLALTPETSGGLPPLHHHFFEFIEESRWDRKEPEFLTLDQLMPGPRYQVVVTTIAGLYRYFMNDLVEVTGWFGRTPLLRFVQKGKGVTSLTGEKLYEAQAIQAIEGSTRAQSIATSFFLLIADAEASSYCLLVELESATAHDSSKLAEAVDRGLGELNLEYHSKRDSGRLRPLTVSWLRAGAAERYKAACVKAGQREGQFKPAVLQYRTDLKVSIEELVGA